MEEGESIDPHGGGGGLVCQGEDNACRREEGREKERKMERTGGEKMKQLKEKTNKCWEVFSANEREIQSKKKGVVK